MTLEEAIKEGRIFRGHCTDCGTARVVVADTWCLTGSHWDTEELTLCLPCMQQHTQEQIDLYVLLAEATDDPTCL